MAWTSIGSTTQGSADDGLPRSAPGAVGVDVGAILSMLDEIQAHGMEVHSFMLHRHGQVAAEWFAWPYRPDDRRIMHSFAKSATSYAIGIAIADGAFGLQDKVVSFFPEFLPATVGQDLAAMTVEDLLTMRTGHAAEVGGPAWRAISTSWIAEFFKIPLVGPPGQIHVYSSAASYMLGAVLHRTTGVTLHQYLKPRVFEPLGITGETWDIGADGFNPGGNGLSCTTADMLKLSLLAAQKGRWNGRQLVPAAWIGTSTRDHTGDCYGYHWRAYPAGDFAGVGMFMQCGFVLPQYDATVAITGAMDRLVDMKPLFDRHFAHMFRDEAFTAPADETTFRERLAKEAEVPPLKSAPSSLPSRIDGAVWAVEPNPVGAREINLSFTDRRCAFHLKDADGDHLIVSGIDAWLRGVSTMPGRELHHGYQMFGAPVVAGARWRDESTLELTWVFSASAFRDTVICRFDGDVLTVDRSVNINSAARQWPRLTARRR
jgi:CubicO group peptidase (beta-lactamase class C family)